MKRSALLFAAALGLLLAALALKGLLLTLPEVPDRPAAGAFDANRAAARLQRVLGDERPHPVDSAANDAVRARLIAEMRRVGLAPRVTDDFACNGFTRARVVACARVRNVIATIPPRYGDEPARHAPGMAADARGASAPAHDQPQAGGGVPPGGRHLLLSAHYDSTFAGPGAADDGIGIATLLETAHLLRGQALRRPVTFLFNEGEEMGLIGARAFLARDPLAARVGAVLNFEARGVTGPAVMFETSRPNGTAMAHFARSADRPLANSLSTDLYRLIPNSTDVTVYEERDWTILNFAIMGNETRYHSAGDDLAALDRRSLRHMGDQALALTLDLATRAPPAAAGDRIYADLLGRQLVTLPLLFGLLLLAILLVFFALETWRRRALGRSLAAAVAGIAGAAAVAWVGQAILGLIRDGDYWRGYPLITHLALYASAMAACLLALLLIAKLDDRTRLRTGFWLVFMLAGAAVSAIAPGGSIFFLLPPLAVAAGVALERWRPGAERIGALAGIFLLYVTFGPALALFEELMSNGPHWIFAPLAATLLMPALIELRPLIARIPRPFALAAAGDLFLLGWLAVALTPAYSDDRRQLFTIDYVWDADARRGRWSVNNDGRRVPYAADWQREVLPHSPRRRWVANAPAIPVAAPSVELLGSVSPRNPGRALWLRLRTGGADSVALIAAAGAPVRRAGAAGFSHPIRTRDPDDKFVLRCVGRSCDGAVIEIEIGPVPPVAFTIVGTRSGLPPAAAPLVAARPALAQPQYAPDSTIAIARIRL